MKQNNEKKGIFKKFTSASVALMQRWLPDPFIFCAILTFFVFIASLLFTKASIFDVIGYLSLIHI